MVPMLFLLHLIRFQPGFRRDIVSRRPDLLAAQRRWAATEARVEEAKAALYPRVSLTASAGTSSEESQQSPRWGFLCLEPDRQCDSTSPSKGEGCAVKWS